MYSEKGIDHFNGLAQDCGNSIANAQELQQSCAKPWFDPDTVFWKGTSIWVRTRRCGCLVTWFCYQMIAKPGNKTAAPSWPDPLCILKSLISQTIKSFSCRQYKAHVKALTESPSSSELYASVWRTSTSLYWGNWTVAWGSRVVCVDVLVLCFRFLYSRFFRTYPPSCRWERRLK